jgi:hypothetical protein
MLVNIPYMEHLGFCEKKKNLGRCVAKNLVMVIYHGNMGKSMENPSSFMAHFDANIPHSGGQWDH